MSDSTCIKFKSTLKIRKIFKKEVRKINKSVPEYKMYFCGKLKRAQTRRDGNLVLLTTLLWLK